MGEGSSVLNEMNARSREVFRRLVDAYLETGEPVGSRTLTRAMSELAEKPELSGTIIILIAIPETMVILGFVVAVIILLGG